MKKEFKTFYFNFNAPLHISDSREDYGSSVSTIYSDTLYAAVFSILSKTGNLPETAENTGELGCTISNLFTFTTLENKIIHFFPKPLIPFNTNSEIAGKLAKKIKKTRWLDKESFQKLLSKEEIELGDENNHPIYDEYLTEANLSDHVISFRQTVPRVSIPRSVSENLGKTSIFYMERIYFSEGSGLYLLAEGNTDLLKKGLEILQFEGIGTDRNIGQGTYTLSEGIIELNLPGKTEYYTNLGLYCPDIHINLEELLGSKDSGEKKCRWDLIRRGGWITQEGFLGIRKKYIYMFTEGSIFKINMNGRFSDGQGAIDLKPKPEGLVVPEHQVYRCGRTIFLPVNI